MNSLCRNVLIAVSLLFVLSAFTELASPHNRIFESSKIILPPLATLVIGYYFGQMNKVKK
ncbi:hypothetical protein Lmac_0863 [Legionella maceachernii]|uniref:Uncharacterized protein n=1 Tax=Legionella maceachernii TaxID=466 RepID=A0A0W0WBK3_9GAMM|nr:hypothetical protein Lmac_0863 [Legionella maceachernii]SKA21135.1 hypothetical protein SAMN02745128_02607 [Legionella maceachernii]SUP02570.1 Uncharacterised protein [Legionella maceachernii]